MKLTPGQAKELVNKGFDTTPAGRVLLLLKQDFHKKAWNEICQCIEITDDVSEVEIYYVGVQIEKYEE